MSLPISSLLRSLSDERNAVHLYQTLAQIEKNPALSEVYTRMAAVEARHAQSFELRLEKAGVPIPPAKLTLRTQILESVARRFGPAAVLPSITAMEQKVSQGFQSASGDSDPQIKQMTAEEGSHARLLGQITRTSQGGLEGTSLAMLEGRHRAAGGNALRAAVLGANDGLVSNLSLVMGVAGANLSNQSILITGLAGLLAGACSMALGEWLSVQSSRELYKHQIEIETQEILTSPQEEAEELALIYQSRGIDKEQALQMASRIMQDPVNAVETLAREELSVDPKELGGSAWEAAITSFILFSIGAIIPVFPYFFLSGMTAVLISISLSTIGLFIIGSGITLFTGRGLLFSGFRQVLFGLAAAVVTYGVGKLIGVSLGG
jgi:VIT1/CCC1 family predicted Fe2+/Mn2+ transporter